MPIFDLVFSVEGTVKGTVEAESKAEARWKVDRGSGHARATPISNTIWRPSRRSDFGC
jgi:hypothetical protein